jgi:hypothetical protein
MSNTALERDLGIKIHNWQTAVEKFLMEYPLILKES